MKSLAENVFSYFCFKLALILICPFESWSLKDYLLKQQTLICQNIIVVLLIYIFVSRSILKHLILDSVARQSEATVVNFMHFSELLVKEYSDYFPLACLWQACILSEWFTGMYLLHAYYAYYMYI